MQIGCHLSVAKGFSKMIEKAKTLGADTVQYFPKNPKSYRPKQFDPDKLREEAASAPADVVTVCHSPYVTNLSTPREDLRRVSIDSIVNDLEIAHHYGTRYLVVHCGKHVGEGEEEGKRLMIDAVNEVLDRFDGDTLLCLENTVGAGTELGWRVEELLEIFDGIEAKEKAGFCFDTCHAFAAGWLDFDNFEAFVDSFTQPDYLSRLAVIHLNDSKIPFDGRRDRHELLGKGEIGAERLGRFLRLPQIAQLPVVIETPVDEEEEYAGEIALARSWLEG